MQGLSQILFQLSRAPLYPVTSQFRIATRSLTPICRVNARLASSSTNFNPTYSSFGGFAQKATAIADKAAPALLTPEERWKLRSKRAIEDSIANPPADAYAGRSVKNSLGLPLAFRTLAEILARNKIRHQVRQAQRHEKKGDKRRRLLSERWRKNFANEVRKKVELVVKMRKRGA